MLSFPLLDFAWVILRRWWTGQSILKSDLAHFHHRLMNRGLSERRSLFFQFLRQLCLDVWLLLLHTQGKVWLLLALGAL